VSAADKSNGGSTSVGEDSSIGEEAVAGENAHEAATERSATDNHSSTPPWQRATSQLRDEAPPQSHTPAAGQHSNNGNHGEPYEDQPTMVQPAVNQASGSDKLFAPGGGHEGNAHEGGAYEGAGGRTSVNLGGGARSSGTPSALRRPGRGPRRASLQVKRVDPWSVLKLALVLSVALFLVWLVAVGVLYGVLDGMGVWDKLNGTYSDLVSGSGGTSGSAPLISIGRVFGVAAVVGAINIVLFTALATVGAFVYNVSADLAGGLEVTLAERE
jgi:hypothetical protein